MIQDLESKGACRWAEIRGEESGVRAVLGLNCRGEEEP